MLRVCQHIRCEQCRRVTPGILSNILLHCIGWIWHDHYTASILGVKYRCLDTETWPCWQSLWIWKINKMDMWPPHIRRLICDNYAVRRTRTRRIRQRFFVHVYLLFMIYFYVLYTIHIVYINLSLLNRTLLFSLISLPITSTVFTFWFPVSHSSINHFPNRTHS